MNNQIPATDIRTLVEQHQFCFLYLNGEAIANPAEFFEQFGLAINYPEVGDNLNRFIDVLPDLENWAPCPDKVSGYVI